MKFRVLILCLTVPLLLSVFESCNLFCTDSCCGTTFTTSYFEVDGVELSGTDTSAVRYDSINVMTQFEPIEIAQRLRKNAIFINEAYGCSPPLPNSRDTLQNIRVIANSDYDAEHQAGDLLNDIISIGINYETGTQPLFEYLAGLELNADELYWIEYIFNFSKAPADTIQHSFTIEFVFEDKVISVTTDQMTITP